MCGRMNVSDPEEIRELLGQLGIELDPRRIEPRFNVAPSLALPTVLPGPQLVSSIWGIVPPWQGAGRKYGPLINARAESAWDKPTFRRLMESGRAIIPANGFYEWHREGKRRSAYYIRPVGQPAFAFAALCQVSRDGEPQSCVLTTAANRPMAAVHDRMPVMLSGAQMRTWLDSSDRAELESLLQPAPEASLQILRVSDYVNNARNEGPRCSEPLAEA